MTQQPNPPAGWHPQADGQLRYWDGQQWTDHYAPGAAAPAKRGMSTKVKVALGAVAALARDTWAVAKAVKDAGLPVKLLQVVGTFPMQDKYGSAMPNAEVHRAALTKETIDKVQYDNLTALSWDNLPKLTAEGVVFLHPALRE